MGLELIVNDEAVGLMSAGEFLAFIRWLQSLDGETYPEMSLLGEEPWCQAVPDLYAELTAALKHSPPADRLALGPANDLLKAIRRFKRDDDAVLYYTDGVNFASDDNDDAKPRRQAKKRKQRQAKPHGTKTRSAKTTVTRAKSTVAKGRRKASDKAKSNVLSLNLYREPFDAILAGEKKTEYRDNTDYWRRRLAGREYVEAHFRNGYATQAPFIRVECKGVRKIGKGRGSRFAIRLGRVLEAQNVKSR
jgi:hypothetical protein